MQDYMQRSDNGSILFLCEKLPDKGFIDAVKICDVCRARLLTRAEKKALGQPGRDVELVSFTGEKEIVSRSQLSSSYKHCNGKSIKIRNLSADKRFYVFKFVNPTNYKVINIPNNCSCSIGGNNVTGGNYLVCLSDGQGNPIRDTMHPVTAKMFRKMFKIPMQSVIKRHLGSAPNKSIGLFDRDRNVTSVGRSRAGFNPANNSRVAGNAPSRQYSVSLGSEGDFSSVTPNIPRAPQQRQQPAASAPVQSQNNVRNMNNAGNASNRLKAQFGSNLNNQAEQQKESHFKYTAVQRIISIHNNSLIGFTIKELSTGKVKQLQYNQVYKLCEAKLVDNIMLVRRENGVSFLKGNNIRIESLPQVIA